MRVLTTFESNDGNVPNKLALLMHTAVSADNLDRKAGTCCRVKLLAPNWKMMVSIRWMVAIASVGE